MRTRPLNGWVDAGVAVVEQHEGDRCRGQQEEQDALDHGGEQG